MAISIDLSGAYPCGAIEGVAHYIRDHEPWEFHLVNSPGETWSTPNPFSELKADGIIARIDTPEAARAIAACGLPAVDICSGRLLPTIPWVATDDRLIAQMGAGHLVQRGFKHLAFCGDDRFTWSNSRRDYFAEQALMAGCKHFSLDVSHGAKGFDAPVQQICRWLEQLPKPVGVMACRDSLGQQVLAACRYVGLAVPDEVAVIGVDNDPLFCELSPTPLSSVIPNARAAGYKAAALLAELMKGQKIPMGPHVIPPLGVIARQSTDILAVKDPQIKEAVRFIREHACSGINVSDVARKAALSRRVLELRFKKLFGQTPREEIAQVRLEQVKRLLRETTMPLYQIAEQTGFEHIEYLSVVFKRETKLTPSAYRAEAQR